MWARFRPVAEKRFWEAHRITLGRIRCEQNGEKIIRSLVNYARVGGRVRSYHTAENTKKYS